jgi:ring-1,2-phenylacetyl-CoA epoxidase subunit PaaC
VSAGPATGGTVDYLLALADDALVASQRLGWWISRAPLLEEDVALANIGLDLLGQARLLLTRAGEVEGRGRDEDDLAYRRDEREFRNACLVEREQSDFGTTMVRLLVLSTWQRALYSELRTSTDGVLAGVAGKAVKEVGYHREHARGWVLRLGDGTEESHRRVQRALDAEWPWVEELFDSTWIDPVVLSSGVGTDPGALRTRVLRDLTGTLAEATLEVPDVPPAVARGRRGLHTEELGPLLAEMQHLARSHPGATW